MEKYKWVPQDDFGAFPNGSKWEYFVDGVKAARIVRFNNSPKVLPGQECQYGVSFDDFKSAAKHVVEKYK